MSKELEALDRLIAVGDPSKYWNSNYFVEDVNIVKQALQRLETIDNAKPNEVLKSLERITAYLLNRTKEIDFQDLRDIEQALLKAQNSEEDKAFLKHLHNTEVKVPLVSIFNGLSKEKRFAYIEHIYYHWEEMKEALEAEIEDIKTEKENLESKAQKQEKVLKIIKEKRVNVDELLDCIRLCNTDSEALERYNDKVSLIWNDPNDYLLTKEEFELLKRWLGNE